jgi:trk system potassium uptake protein TrkA
MKQKNLTERWQAFRQKPAAAAEQTTQKNNGRSREFVVIGMGRFGKSVATTLVSLGHDVLAIDSDKYRVQELSTELPNIIRLDATNAEGLRQVGIENFDTGLVCMSGNFESNLLAATLLLKFGVTRVICKAKTHTQKTILETIGVHKVVLPEHEAGVHLGRQLATHHFIDYLEVNEGISIIELEAPPKLCGKTLAECDLRKRMGLSVIAVNRDKNIIANPRADFKIEPGDELMVIGSIEDAERLSNS